MSADITRIDYEELAQIVRDFNHQHEIAQGLQQGLHQAFDPLSHGHWQGVGYAAFAAEMTSRILPATAHLQAALAMASSVMSQCSELIRRAEEEAAALFSPQAADSSEEGGGVLGFIGDLFGGAWSELSDMVHGLTQMVWYCILFRHCRVYGTV